MEQLAKNNYNDAVYQSQESTDPRILQQQMDDINNQIKQISFELQMQRSKFDYMERLKTKQDIDAEI